MAEYVITTENAADLPESFVKENEIGVLSLYYTIDAVSYTHLILNWKCDGRLLGGLAMAAVPVYLFSNQAAQPLTQYLFPNYAGYILSLIHI